MKAAIYTPYLETLGGGERYMISIARALSDEGWDVYLESKDEKILNKIQARLGINTDDIRITEDIKRGDGYDLLVWLSDGSIPTLFARKNVLHFQRPFYDVDGRSLMNRAKFFRINSIIVNSEFTKKWIDEEYPKKSTVLYPPVDVESFKPGKKENIILTVGRFSQLEQSKRQDILVEVFKDLYDAKNSVFRKDKWKLVLAGGSDVGRTDFVDKLKSEAKTYPITILENKPFSEIKKLYANAKIFWSAAGYGIDEEEAPERVEHFGIVTVEAMSAGCVPFVYNAGGHKEVITDGNGFLWKTKEELKNKMLDLLKNKKGILGISKNDISDSKKYSYAVFKKNFLNLI